MDDMDIMDDMDEMDEMDKWGLGERLALQLAWPVLNPFFWRVQSFCLITLRYVHLVHSVHSVHIVHPPPKKNGPAKERKTISFAGQPITRQRSLRQPLLFN